MILRRGSIKRYYKRNKETEYRIAVPGVTEFVHWPPFTEGPAPQWALGARQRPVPRPTSPSLAPACYLL